MIIPRALLLCCGLVAVSSAAVIACGGRVGDDPGSGVDAGAGADGAITNGTDAGATPDGATTGKQDAGASKLCPRAQPFQNDLCSVEGLECEYGDSYRLRCNVLAACRGGRWSLTAPDTVVCGAPVNGPSCPKTVAEIAASDGCPQEGAACVYSTNICECSALGTGPGGPPVPPTWSCFPDPPAPGCPFPRPELGTECTTPGATCEYSVCGNEIVCAGRLWHRGAGRSCN